MGESKLHKSAATNGARRKPAKPRPLEPAPVTTTECLAWRPAVLAAGSVERVFILDIHTTMTRNSAHLAGPPWRAGS